MLVGKKRIFQNQVAVASYDSRFRIRKQKVISFAQAVLRRLNLSRTFLSIVFVPDPQMRFLNRKYLNHGSTTDVLAFPFGYSQTRSPRIRGTSFLGEVVVSPNRAQVYSKRLGISFNEELARYVCHGILHLLGHRDHTPRARNQMRRAEDQLLHRFRNHVKRIY